MMQTNSLPVDIIHQLEMDFQKDADRRDAMEILKALYEENLNIGVMIQAIRGLIYISKGRIDILRNYCLPYLQYDPRDILMEAEQLAGNPGHWFGIPFDQMDSFSGELPENQVEELDDGLSF